MKFTGFFFICMLALFAIVVSARHVEDSFESAQLTEFEDGLGQRNYRSKRDELGDFPSLFKRGHRLRRANCCPESCIGNCYSGNCGFWCRQRNNCC